MKKFIVLLLLSLASYLGFVQYKFNVQIDWWGTYKSLDDRCQLWEEVVPMKIKLEEKFGKYRLKKYAHALDEWKKYVKAERDKNCTEYYEWRDLHPKRPLSDEWTKFRKDTGLSNFVGYLKEIGTTPLKANGTMFTMDRTPTVILKSHPYGGGDAKCSIYKAESIPASPLPFLSRTLYALDCKNDKSNAEGWGGFMTTSTIDNLEVIK